jgi:hypothetical protein
LEYEKLPAFFGIVNLGTMTPFYHRRMKKGGILVPPVALRCVAQLRRALPREVKRWKSGDEIGGQKSEDSHLFSHSTAGPSPFLA